MLWQSIRSVTPPVPPVAGAPGVNPDRRQESSYSLRGDT